MRQRFITCSVLAHAIIALANLWIDYPLLSGPSGLLPNDRWMQSIKAEFSPWNSFLFFPSFFLLISDYSILIYTGILAALAGIIFLNNGLVPRICCGVCYLVLLSFSQSQGVLLWFPWDCLLLELLFLTAIVPEKQWPFRFLLFRVMFGFGKHKFFGSSVEDLLYTKSMACWQPLGTNIGLWMSVFLPDSLHVLAILITFLIEMVCPFGFLVGDSKYRKISAGLTIAFMTAIQLSGHFGWFNTLTACLAFSVYIEKDVKSYADKIHFTASVKKSVSLMYITISLIFLIPSQWTSPGLFYHNSFGHESFDVLRIVSSWRILHSYGVFPPKSMPMIKPVGRFEVETNDGQHILLDYHYQVSRTTKIKGTWPFQVAPLRFPRFDYIYAFYAASHVLSLGTRLGPFWGSGKQYIDSVAKVLLENAATNPLLKGLFRNDLRGLKIVRVEFHIVGLVPNPHGGWIESSVDLDKVWRIAEPRRPSSMHSVTDSLPPSMIALRRKSLIFKSVSDIIQLSTSHESLEANIQSLSRTKDPIFVSQRLFDAAVILADKEGTFSSEHEWLSFVTQTYTSMGGPKISLVSDTCGGPGLWNTCHAAQFGGFIGCLMFLHLVPFQFHSPICPLIMHSNRIQDSPAYRKIPVPNYIYTLLVGESSLIQQQAVEPRR